MIRMKFRITGRKKRTLNPAKARKMWENGLNKRYHDRNYKKLQIAIADYAQKLDWDSAVELIAMTKLSKADTEKAFIRLYDFKRAWKRMEKGGATREEWKALFFPF